MEAPIKIVRFGLLLAALAATVSSSAGDYSEIQISVIPVAGCVSMLKGAGGNMGVCAGEDGILLIDDQFEPLSAKIKAALATLGDGEIKFLFNTHWHGDHTGGNAVFGKETTIIAHHNVRKRLQSRQEIKLFNMVSEPQPKEALPVITFDDSLTVHFNGEEIVALHLPPGHTDSDTALFFEKANVVHMGDLFFSGTFPFVDLDNGGDVEGFIENVAVIMAQLKPDVRIIPGHGPLSTMDDLRSYYKMLVETTAHVRKRLASGKKLAEIQAEGFPEKWAMWGKGMISSSQWIAMISDSYSNH